MPGAAKLAAALLFIGASAQASGTTGEPTVLASFGIGGGEDLAGVEFALHFDHVEPDLGVGVRF